MVRRRCPDTGQMLEFPADCRDCEFLGAIADVSVCRYKMKPEKHIQVRK